MRFVHVAVPIGQRAAVCDALDDLEVDYTVTPDDSENEYVAQISFPLPMEAVEPVLDELEAIGLGERAYVAVLPAETIFSHRFEQFRDLYEDEPPNERVAHEEMRSEAIGLMPDRRTYVLLSVVSAIVATAGLLLDSSAVVVGSMVIAPLIGPTMTTSIATVLYDEELFRTGVSFQVYGFVLALVSSTLFAFFVKFFFLVPPGVEITAIEQIAGRLTPDLLALAVALGSGVAGARSLSSDVSTSLVGVMMAAALIPPTAAVGIGIAWQLLDVVTRAGLLVIVNTLSINLMALVTLWYSGYRPDQWERRAEAKRSLRRRVVVLAVGVLLLSVVLAAFTFTAFQTGALEQGIREDVAAVLDQPRFAQLSLLEVRVTFAERTFGRRASRVVVTVTAPGGDTYPALESRIDRRIDERAGYDVETEVRFIAVVRSD